MLDDFVMYQQAEETFTQYAHDYEMDDVWYEVNSAFCEELDLEPECYDD